MLAKLVAHVTTLGEEVAPGVARDAAVAAVTGPLAEGWAAGAPYDVILFDGAVERVPLAIVSQLAEGGRLAAPIAADGVVRLSIGRKAGGSFGMTSFVEAEAPMLPGFAAPSGFRF